MRFSLLTVLLLTAFAGIASAALIGASPLWVSITYTAAIVSLLVAILGIVYRRGARRAFWIGFLTFGCGYLFGSRFWLITESHLISWELLDHVYTAMGSTLVRSDFLSVGRSVAIIVSGLMGGLVARWFHWTQQLPHRDDPSIGTRR